MKSIGRMVIFAYLLFSSSGYAVTPAISTPDGGTGGTSPASAAPAPATLPAIYSLGPADLANVSCDAFCPVAVSGTAPTGQWCANHGGASTIPADAGATRAMTTSAACPYPLAPGESCESVANKLFQCQWRGQVGEYCSAYNATKEGSGWDKVVLAMDFTAAATCTAECASPASGLGPVSMVSACKYAGAAASGTEMVAAATIYKHTRESMGRLGMVGGGVDFFLVRGAQQVESDGEKNVAKGNRKLACAAAAFFDVMTVLRYKNMSQNNGTRADSCNSVKSLLSQNVTAPGSNSYGGSYTNTAAQQTTAVRLAASLPSTPINEAPAISAGLPAQASASTDGGVLRSAGFDRAIANTMPNFNPDAILKKMDQAGPSAALAAAVQGAGSAAASATGALAAAVQKDPYLFDPSVASSVAHAGGGADMNGGGGKSAGGGDPMSALTSLFDKKSEDGGGPGVRGTMAFRAPASGDIWHTGTDLNLFQIVSGRLTLSADRVSSP